MLSGRTLSQRSSPSRAYQTIDWLGLPVEDWQRYASAQRATLAYPRGSAEFEHAVQVDLPYLAERMRTTIAARRRDPQDDVISFLCAQTVDGRLMTEDEVFSIVDLMMRRVREQLDTQGLGLELTDAAKTLLSEKGYDPALGARPLRRAIQRLVEDALSERILWKEFRAGETIIVDAENGEIAFRAIESIEPPPPVELAEAGPAE